MTEQNPSGRGSVLPCPFVGCAHHLWWERASRGDDGQLREPTEFDLFASEWCVLDVIEQAGGEVPHMEIARLMRMSRADVLRLVDEVVSRPEVREAMLGQADEDARLSVEQIRTLVNLVAQWGFEETSDLTGVSVPELRRYVDRHIEGLYRSVAREPDGDEPLDIAGFEDFEIAPDEPDPQLAALDALKPTKKGARAPAAPSSSVVPAVAPSPATSKPHRSKKRSVA